MRGHDRSGREPRKRNEVREDHRPEGKGPSSPSSSTSWGSTVLPSSSVTPIRRAFLTTSCQSCTGPFRPSITRSHKNDLARAMVAQSEHAFFAMAQGNAPEGATVKILEYKDMEPFFIKGERDEP